MLLDSIENFGVYSDKILRDYIYNLEKKYDIKDEIDLFNTLVNFSKNKNVPYHGWFKYREGFSHTLIKELLVRNNIKENQYVLDPFCGSGTTVVEAALNGISGVGIDINPMSAFLSRVKCRSYTNEELEKLEKNFSCFIDELKKHTVSEEYKKQYLEVEKFFNEKNFERLLSIKELLHIKRNQFGDKIYEFFLCGYICIIESVSDRKRDGNGLKTSLSKIDNVETYYEEVLIRMLEDVKEYRISGEVYAVIESGNAMQLSKIVKQLEMKTEKKIGAIMYSPPYANSFDYFESYKMEVILTDYAMNMKEVGNYRKQAIESFVGRKESREKSRDFIFRIAEEIEKAIPEKELRTGKRDSRTRKVPRMLEGYFSDMENVIEESSKVLTSGQKCYIVVDQSAYLGRIIPTDLFLAAISEEYDFEVNEIIVCRLAKTSGQQIQLYPYLKNTLRESIVVLEKK